MAKNDMITTNNKKQDFSKIIFISKYSKSKKRVNHNFKSEFFFQNALVNIFIIKTIYKLYQKCSK